MPKEQERTQQKAKKANKTRQNTKQIKPQAKHQKHCSDIGPDSTVAKDNCFALSNGLVWRENK